MAIIEISPQLREQDTHTRQNVTLEGVRVRIDTYTNKVDGLWYHDVYDADGAAIFLGVRLTAGIDLWFPYRYNTGLPPGVLFIADHDSPFLDPGLDSFQDREASLWYQEAGS
jgi:hypothetical protein